MVSGVVKLADDAALLVPEKTDVQLEEDFDSKRNRFQIINCYRQVKN